MNNKSAPVPEGTRGEVERFLRRLGYRLVVRSVDHTATAHAGGELDVTIAWENVGVAPPYRDYRVALQLKSEKEKGAKPIVLVTDHSIQGWLPGTRNVHSLLRVPTSIPPGRYELAVGVVDPGSRIPAVRLAILGRDAEGWYPVSHARIEP